MSSRAKTPSRALGGADEALARYRSMRDFAATPEPEGKRATRRRAAASLPAFYIQRHAARRLHYDFRLELDGVLRSWAVPKGPSLDPSERRLAVETEDHPLDYGDFEGVIPEKQYGAGDVLLWDRGTWTTTEPDPAAALARGHLKFHLEGHKLHGGWALVRMHGSRDEDDKHHNWLLIKERDDAAREGAAGEITRLAPGSVRGLGPEDGQSAAAAAPPAKSRAGAKKAARGRAARAALPAFVTPQLATLVREPPAGEGWVWEIKYDGYRLLARLEEGKARLFTRNGRDWSHRLPSLARRLAELGLDGSWLDGEIVVPGEDGLPDFQALQNAFDGAGAVAVVYYLFDAPWVARRDLTREPLVERKRVLAEALAEAGADGPLRFSEHFSGGVKAGLEQACRLGLEGLIGKRTEAPYLSGRGRDWIKLKCRPRQEFVIGGYTEPRGSRKGFGSLLLGLYDGAGELHYAGRVGTGFTEASLARLASRLAALERKEAPFAEPPAERGDRIHWVKPSLVAEVEFAGWTAEGVLRQAAFNGLREDKPPATVHEEQPLAEAPQPEAPQPEAPQPEASRRRAGKTGARKTGSPQTEAPKAEARKTGAKAGQAAVAGVPISHPERVIWPDVGLTKADLARYYEAIAPWFVPHVAARPLSLLRCPEGSAAECFFQRHMEQRRPEGLETFLWERSSGKRHHYLYVEGLEGVIGLVQRGVIEFHTWGSTMPRPDRPDRLTIDLDPAPDVAWAQVVEGARLAHALLDELGLTSFLKTTGGKGLHLVAPLQRRHHWDEVKAFARAIAQHLARVLPERFTANMAKGKRSGRIFVDYLRNDDGATAVAAFSARARPGAPVSTPLAWEELSPSLRPDELTVSSVPQRLEKLGRDPWKGYDTMRQSLTKAMKERLGL